MDRKYIFSLLLVLSGVFFTVTNVQAQDKKEKDKDKIELYQRYTPISWFYNEYWAQPFATTAIQSLHTVLFPRINSNAKILDLMCGSGRVTNALKKRGYKMTGLDASEGMLNFARVNAPGVPFMLDDARLFDIKDEFDAVICMNNGLNHILQWKELVMAYSKVYASLKKGGYFVFDMSLEEHYKNSFSKQRNWVERDNFSCLYNFNYNPQERLGAIDFVMFLAKQPAKTPEEKAAQVWGRVSWRVTQYCYSHLKIIDALEKVGFTVIKVYDGQDDLKRGAYNKGRRYYLCQKK
ncbi:class I SAM-dependent methyltransferase [Microscilla marina]|nr:class I SAM-dependent methyltransferase [Microscilla marina]